MKFQLYKYTLIYVNKILNIKVHFKYIIVMSRSFKCFCKLKMLEDIPTNRVNSKIILIFSLIIILVYFRHFEWQNELEDFQLKHKKSVRQGLIVPNKLSNLYINQTSGEDPDPNVQERRKKIREVIVNDHVFF